jgi:hypothetical protein
MWDAEKANLTYVEDSIRKSEAEIGTKDPSKERETLW